MFSFDSGTSAAVKQMRNMLLLANAGSMNLQTDEIGANLLNNKEILAPFLELFSGRVKNKLIKNTSEAVRGAEMHGVTPTNMMLFGVPQGLLDGAKIENEFISMLAQGYARRCFFGYVIEDPYLPLDLLSPMEQLVRAKAMDKDATLQEIAFQFEQLANIHNAHKQLIVPDETAEIYFQYKNDCAEKAHKFPANEEIIKAETKQRFYKAIKAAGAFAFIDGTAEITPDHLLSAIGLAEASGEALQKIVKRERDYVRLAKHLSTRSDPLTQADLIEDLPFYSGSKANKADMMAYAIAYGYKNNIIIRRTFADSIEFFSGETIQETDLSKTIVSYSTNDTDQYQNEFAPFDQLDRLFKVDGMHWINHHSSNGKRDEDRLIEGFNLLTFDIDGGENAVSLRVAKELLKDYKTIYYTTKRHTEAENRYRIVIPTNYTLELNREDYKAMMKSIMDWLPFEVDSQVGQRARKWLSNNGHLEYTDGKLFDVLPFIPRTSKNEEFNKEMQSYGSLNGLERWVLTNSSTLGRNNTLLRYALLLADMGFPASEVQTKIFEMNNKLPDKLSNVEIQNTILVSVGNKLRGKAA